MGRLRCVRFALVGLTISLFSLLPACGGHKPAGTSPFPAKITLNPPISASMQLGSTLVFTASAQNGSNSNLSPVFTFTSSNPAVVNISPAGVACAGSWNAPFYNICTAGGGGTAEITAFALGTTSPPTLVYVHPPIDSIQVSVVPPVNPPPPACPGQIALPAACALPFNQAAASQLQCVSQNQVQTVQATAFSQGVDITASVGPFTWTQANLNVVTITPIVTSSSNLVTNQATVVANTPGQTLVVATASGVASAPYVAATCPVQCIDLELTTNGLPSIGTTSFITNKGTSETITATAVDIQGCAVPKPPLTWTSTEPAAISAGTATTGCPAGTTCTLGTPQPGAAAITASCTPPTCNIGFPLNPAGYTSPSLFIPQPVYPVTAISGLVTGATSTANVLATSQDCFSNSQCTVAMYNIPTNTNIAANPIALPTPPNSLMFDSAGDKAYMGSQYGAALLTLANITSSSTSPFTPLPAAGTPQGLVTGKVIAVSPNGSMAVFSDTVSTPNQAYVVNTASSAASTTFLNINSAIAAAFSPDNSKAFVLGNGGNTLYVNSALQAVQSYPLTAPADAIAFSSTGTFALLAGGAASPSTLDIFNTCNNSQLTLPLPVQSPPIPPLPSTPIFLKMVPAGSAPSGNATIPNLQQSDLENLDVFIGIDNTGIDVFATTTTTPISPAPASLCPMQQIGFANTVATMSTPSMPFYPIHIPLGRTFHPLNFFLSPDGTRVFIITSDQGVLVFNFTTQATSAIPLNGNAAPVAADMTVDGTLLYVAGSDGQLHELNTLLATDELEITFGQLPNSSNNFCFSSFSCALNIVAIKP